MAVEEEELSASRILEVRMSESCMVAWFPRAVLRS